MRILHFGSDYLPNKGGNVVRMTNMLENNHAGAELFVMTTALKQDFDDEEYYKKMSIRVLRIQKLEDGYKAIPEAIKKYNIDIVITHVIPANIIACRSLPFGFPIMTEIHTLIDSGTIRNWCKGILHRFYLNKRTCRFFVLSMGAAKYIQKKYGVNPNKITFLPNGCNRTNATYSRGRKGFFTFGYVGTFYKFQGIEILCNNIEKILSIGRDVRIYLVGGGEMEDKIDYYAKKYPGRVIFTGLLTKQEVEAHMREIDVLMIPRPSTLETETAIPLKIFDSIEAGKPVIISDVFGLKEVLNKDEAYIYSSSDDEGLYHACIEAYSNRQLNRTKYENALTKIEQWPEWKDIHKIQYDACCITLEGNENSGVGYSSAITSCRNNPKE